jgi:ribosomal protein S18 acetylase RimI-like enzyme
MANIRPALYNDVFSMIDIEQQSYENPWDSKSFEKYIKTTLVYLDKKKLLGFMSYVLRSDGYIEIINMAVSPHFRRQGIAKSLVTIFKGSMEYKGIVAYASERNVPYQCLLRRCGIPCMKIEKDYYDKGDDGYVFTYDN